MKPLLELVPDAKYPLRLVEADLCKPEAWPNAVHRCTYVLHVASPVALVTTDEATIVRTAVQGVTNVLQACAEAGSIKHVVMTSSAVVIMTGTRGNPANPPDYVYTEKDWAIEDICTGYAKSKLKAEQAAWDFVKKLDESQQFEFTVVNPSYIQGPLLSASSGEVSQEFCLRLLNGSLPAVPDLSYDFIDVRDVAAAHIAAMENGDANGHRYILSNRIVHLKELSQIIRDEFEPQGYKIASRDLPKVVVWVGKFFSTMMKDLYHSLGKNLKLSNERMITELGVHPRPVEESIIDMPVLQSY